MLTVCACLYMGADRRPELEPETQTTRGIIMKTMLKKFWAEEDGGQVVEWPLIAAILAIVIIAAWTALGGSLNTALSNIGTVLTTGTQQAVTDVGTVGQ